MGMTFCLLDPEKTQRTDVPNKRKQGRKQECFQGGARNIYIIYIHIYMYIYVYTYILYI